MNGKYILIFILSIVAVGLGYLKLSFPSELLDSSQAPSASPSPSPTSRLSLNWPVYETTYFSLSYPQEASASSDNNGIDSEEWRITYMGDLQKKSGRTQSELWDGYAVSVTRFVGAQEGGAAIQAEADRKSTIEACGEENVTPITPSRVGEYETLAYTGGCLGSAVIHYFDVDKITYRITNMVQDPADQSLDYEAITAEILSTFVLK